MLDYPYVYELDGNKLYCKKPDPTSPTGLCDGEIDYDDGFNFLKCTKCGAIYKAKELEKKIKNEEIIVERKGDIKMVIRAKGGTANVDRTINTEVVGSSLFKPVKTSTPKATSSDQHIVVREVPEKKVEPKKVEKKAEEKKVEVTPVTKTVNGVPTNKEAIASSPVTFGDLVEEIKTSDSPVENIENALDEIIKNLGNITIDSVRNDTLYRVISTIAGQLENTADNFDTLIMAAHEIILNTEDEEYENAVTCSSFIDLITENFSVFSTVESCDIADGKITADIETIMLPEYKKSNGDHVEDDYIIDQTQKFYICDTDDVGVVETPSDNIEKNTQILNIQWFDAELKSVKDILVGQDDQQVLVIKDQNGEYLIDGDGSIVVIDTINSQYIDDIEIVSKNYLNDADNLIEKLSEDESVEEVVEETEEVEEDEVVESAPVGVFAPNSGMSVEEFLEQEESAEETSEEVETSEE